MYLFRRTYRGLFKILLVTGVAHLCLYVPGSFSAPDPSTITIPAEHGRLTETHASADPQAPLVICIQEAHADYETQKNLRAILLHLIENYGLQLVLVEGGEGDLNLDYFREYGSPPEREQAAEKFLKAGVLSAEEYLDIASDHPLTLWGIEDRRLYEQNWRALQQAEKLRESFAPFLEQARGAAELLRPRVLSAASLELEQAHDAFRRQKMDFSAYLEVLWRFVEQKRMDTSAYEDLERLVSSSRLKQQLNLDEVKTEQQALVQRLKQTAGDKVLAPLTEKAAAVKAGTAEQAEFYRALADAAESGGIALDAYPHLKDYSAYLQQRRTVQIGEVSDQLERLTTALRAALSEDSPQGRRLVTILQEMELIKGLVQTKLPPDEYRRFRDLPKSGLLCGWRDFLEEQSATQGLSVPPFSDCSALEAQLPQFAAFYEAALLRDQAMAQRVAAKLKETGQPVAALIIGGFHAPGITRLLEEQGMSVSVVTPKVGGADNSAVYEAALQYKRGLLPLDEVLAPGPAAEQKAER